MPERRSPRPSARRARTIAVGSDGFFLEGVVDWLTGDARIEVVDRAQPGALALERIESLRAELVRLDVTLLDTTGFEVARSMEPRPDAPMVVMPSFDDSRAVRLAARAAGADGPRSRSETAVGLYRWPGSGPDSKQQLPGRSLPAF